MESRRKEIYIIRHGQVENPTNLIYGRTYDLPLSDIGRLQVTNLAVSIERRGIIPGIIVTSPLLRTRQTAEVLSRTLGNVAIIEDNDLLEVWSDGLEGKHYTTLSLLGWDPYNYQGDYRALYKIESPEKIADRMVRVVGRVMLDYQKVIPFFVSHGDPIAFLSGRLINPSGVLPSIVQLEQVREYPKKAQARRVRFERGRVVEQEFITGTERFRRGPESET